MSSSSLPQSWHSPTKLFHSRISCRRNGFIPPANSIPGIGVFISFSLLVGLILYMTFLSPHGLLFLRTMNRSMPIDHATSPSDGLSLDQIKDIVVPTRGFFSRDYGLWLGWNNVSVRGNLPVIRAELMAPNRCNIFSKQPSSKQICLIPPWLSLRLFTHVHASVICMFFFSCFTPLVASSKCVIESSDVCADYAVMVNRGDAVGKDEWRKLPIEKQMAFRIPISLMIDLPHLRAHHPVITVSEYLRFHGQDPESESSRGSWERELYHSHSNVFEADTDQIVILRVNWPRNWL